MMISEGRAFPILMGGNEVTSVYVAWSVVVLAQ